MTDNDDVLDIGAGALETVGVPGVSFGVKVLGLAFRKVQERRAQQFFDRIAEASKANDGDTVAAEIEAHIDKPGAHEGVEAGFRFVTSSVDEPAKKCSSSAEVGQQGARAKGHFSRLLSSRESPMSKKKKMRSATNVVKDIRRKTRRKFSAEEKIRIVLEGLRGEQSVSELCRREAIAQTLYYRWSKEFLEAGKQRLAGDTKREATPSEVKELQIENIKLKQMAAELMLELRVVKKSLLAEDDT